MAFGNLAPGLSTPLQTAQATSTPRVDYRQQVSMPDIVGALSRGYDLGEKIANRGAREEAADLALSDARETARLKSVATEALELQGLPPEQQMKRLGERYADLYQRQQAGDDVDVNETTEAIQMLATNPAQFNKMLAQTVDTAQRLGVVGAEQAISGNTPASVKAFNYYQNLSPEEKKQWDRQQKIKDETTMDKEQVKFLAKVAANPDEYSPEEVAAAREAGFVGGERTYGSLGPGKGDPIYSDLLDAEHSFNRMSEVKDLLNDMIDEGNSKVGTSVKSGVYNWLGEVTGLDITNAQELNDVIQAGTFDIGVQLAEALKPVSQANIDAMLKGLRGGNMKATLAAVNSTQARQKDAYKKHYKRLKAAKAGVIGEMPELLKYHRDPTTSERIFAQQAGNEPEQERQPMGGYQLGQQDSGYEYIGGDPTDPASWRQL